MKLTGAKIILIILINLVISLPLKASELNIEISEIAWMGSEISSNDEWIELKNNTFSNIDLTGWTLIAQDGTPSINLTGTIPANGYFLLERTDDESVPSVTADQIYTGALGNSGEILELRDSENNLIDIIDASSGWQAGDNTEKLTIEKVGANWQNSENAGGTPKAENGISNPAPLEEEGSPEENSGQGYKNQEEASSDETTIGEEELNINYQLGDVVINEFVSDPADGEQEFIELYNAKNTDINLDNWRIEEGSKAKTNLNGIIKANNFFVIEKPKGNLNNKGDIIILRDVNGNLIDKVAYGNWDDGSLDNNAPVATDPYSVARKFDGQNTYNNANDFAVTTTITKNKFNIITGTNEDSRDEALPRLYDYSNNIIISEVFPNPQGADNDNEFIEVYNNGEKDINLVGWEIGDNSKRKYKIKEDKIIKAGEYLVFYRKETKIALNNSGDSIKLFQPLKDEAYLKIEYKKSIEEWSYNADCRNMALPCSYIWSEIITPGTENNIKTINHAPIIDFDFPDVVSIATPTIFDSSDTVDENGDELKYFWSFGDGFTNILPSPEHTFFTAGVYTIKLSVSDGENEIAKEKIIKVIDKNINQDINFLPQSTTTKENIIITEILPNPYGADSEGEWIEIYNPNDEPVNLFNWSIDDGEGGSKPYKIKDDIWLKANEYHVFDREDIKIGLNNTGKDFARLFNDVNKLVAEVEYNKTFEGESYAKSDKGEWIWTEVLTPGFRNEELRIKNDPPSQSYGEASELNLYNQEQLWIDPIAELDTQEISQEYLEISLERIKDFLIGDKVKVSGTVAVKPGILGTQYFYIVSSNAGIQIYNYKKDFPDLRVGDYVQVSGEISVSSEEMRIKTKLHDDIKIIKHIEEPKAQLVTSEDINKDNLGALIKITGEVVERKGSSIYLDDGIGEVLVYIKSGSGISAKSIKEGGVYTIIGIISRTKTNIRILPRTPEDIVLKDAESGGVIKQKMPGQVLAQDNLMIAQRDKKLKLFQYLLTVAGGVIVVLGGLLVKLRDI